MVAFVMTKDGKISHTVSKAKYVRMKAEGWRPLVDIRGWNISLSYREKL